MLSEKLQNKYFNMAKNVSTLSDYSAQHLGAVIVYKNHVIADGYNTNKTNPIQKEYNKYRHFTDEHWKDGACHAEMSALIKCRDFDVDWNKASIFIYREKKNHKKANAFCCNACKQALIDRGIKNIYFTVDDGIGYVKLD